MYYIKLNLILINSIEIRMGRNYYILNKITAKELRNKAIELQKLQNILENVSKKLDELNMGFYKSEIDKIYLYVNWVDYSETIHIGKQSGNSFSWAIKPENLKQYFTDENLILDENWDPTYDHVSCYETYNDFMDKIKNCNYNFSIIGREFC